MRVCPREAPEGAPSWLGLKALGPPFTSPPFSVSSVSRVWLPWPWLWRVPNSLLGPPRYQDRNSESTLPWVSCILILWMINHLQKQNNSVISRPQAWICPGGNQLFVRRLGEPPTEVGVALLSHPPRTHGAKQAPRSCVRSLCST